MLDLIVVLFSFLRTPILFFMVAAPVYIGSNSAQGLPFVHVLTNIFLFVVSLKIAFLIGVRQYLTVVLDLHFSND